MAATRPVTWRIAACRQEARIKFSLLRVYGNEMHKTRLPQKYYAMFGIAKPPPGIAHPAAPEYFTKRILFVKGGNPVYWSH